MFDGRATRDTGPATGPGLTAAVVSSVRHLRHALAELPTPEVAALDEGQLEDLLRSLEELKCAAEGLQAVASVRLDASVRAEDTRRGRTGGRHGRGVALRVALARRESHARGTQHLGLAKVLSAELPHTMAALRAGRISEWRATLLARETSCLSREHRAAVDLALAADPDRIEAMGDGELVAEAKKLAYQLDPASVAARRAKAETDRRVSLRPAPDVMSQLSALLPVKDGVAVFAALDAEARTLIAAGDGRGRGQLMADTLVDRVLGRSHPAAEPPSRTGWSSSPRSSSTPADATGPWRRPCTEQDVRSDQAGMTPHDASAAGAAPAARHRTDGSGDDIPTMLHLVVSDEVLFGTGGGSAHLDGYGPVPADLARELTTDGTWIRRLYARPETGALVAADSRARRFPARLGQLIRLRDRRCRMPWCGAPIRHSDHVVAVSDGGRTTLGNGQGLCEACNYAEEADGLTARTRAGPRHSVRTTTPTGRSYYSTAPPLADPPSGVLATENQIEGRAVRVSG